MLAQTVCELENSLTQRLDRNASGFFSEVINGVHSRFAGHRLTEQDDFGTAIIRVLSYLKEKMSFSELLFIPFDKRDHVIRKDDSIYGKQNILEIRSVPINRNNLDSTKYVAKSDNGKVFLSRLASLQYELHLFDQDGEELCKMEFVLTLGQKRNVVIEEWQCLCNHMETVLRELYMQWALALREEEHSQYYVTMRQFTHELGQKSHSGNACMMQMHYQISKLHEQCAAIRDDRAAWSSEPARWLNKLDRTANDMESIFDGIAYLSQLARAKAQGLKFNPKLFDVRYTTLNSMAAQYRIDIRGNGMRIIYKEVDRAYSRVYGDKDLVHIAIHNLVSNAVKYGYPGTNIYYSCYRGRRGTANKSSSDKYTSNQRGIFIEVTDYGLPIPKEDRERIFEDGQRLEMARNDSLGFGLYLTREIMEKHGGYCEVAESEEVSAFSLPSLSQMISLASTVPFNIPVKTEQMEQELKRAKTTGLYNEVVYKDMKVTSEDEDTDVPITARGLFRRGLKPMARTTMRLFFPDEED